MSHSETKNTGDQLGLTARYWKILLTLFFCLFLYSSDTLITGPLVPVLTQVTGTPIAQGGWLISVYCLTAAISVFLFAPFSDRWGHRNMLVVGAVIVGVADFLMSMSTEFTTMLVLRGIAGVGGAFMIPNSLALIGNLIPYQQRGSAVAVVMTAIACASLVGVPLGTTIAHQFTWSATYRSLALLAFLPVLLLIFLLSKEESQHGAISFSQYLRSYKKALTLPFVLFILISSFFWYFGLHGLLQFVGVFFSSEYGLNVQQIGFVYMIAASGYLLGTLGGGRVSDRIGKIKMVMIAGMSAVASLMVFANTDPNLILVIAIIVCWATSVGMGEAPLIALITQLGEKNRGLVLSLNQMFVYLAMSTATASSSTALKYFSFSAIGLMCAFSIVAALLVVKLLVKEPA